MSRGYAYPGKEEGKFRGGRGVESSSTIGRESLRFAHVLGVELGWRKIGSANKIEDIGMFSSPLAPRKRVKGLIEERTEIEEVPLGHFGIPMLPRGGSANWIRATQNTLFMSYY